MPISTTISQWYDQAQELWSSITESEPDCSPVEKSVLTPTNPEDSIIINLNQSPIACLHEQSQGFLDYIDNPPEQTMLMANGSHFEIVDQGRSNGIIDDFELYLAYSDRGTYLYPCSIAEPIEWLPVVDEARIRKKNQKTINDLGWFLQGGLSFTDLDGQLVPITQAVGLVEYVVKPLNPEPVFKHKFTQLTPAAQPNTTIIHIDKSNLENLSQEARDFLRRVDTPPEKIIEDDHGNSVSIVDAGKMDGRIDDFEMMLLDERFPILNFRTHVGQRPMDQADLDYRHSRRQYDAKELFADMLCGLGAYLERDPITQYDEVPESQQAKTVPNYAPVIEYDVFAIPAAVRALRDSDDLFCALCAGPKAANLEQAKECLESSKKRYFEDISGS